MDSLYDYILWMGDCPFSAVPLRVPDAIFLCMTTYFDLSPLFEHATEPIALRDCEPLFDAGKMRFQGVVKPDEYLRIMKAAVSSRRYGELRMSGYVDILVSDAPIQFSAVTFHCEAGWSFIAYRGTDNTLAGWKEDFMISFIRTQAQVMAEQYAANRVSEGCDWYLGGHSKGGNLAVYAASRLPKNRRTALKRVFLLDGPGFCPGVMMGVNTEGIDDLITRVIPGFSVIGRLFEPKIRDTRIVQSSASGLLQHDLVTWGIDHGLLATLEQTDHGSDFVAEVLKQWIGGLKREERKVFVDDVFDALAAGGATTLEELTTEGYRGYEAIITRFRKSSEITRRVLKDLSRQTIQTLLDTLFRRDE